MTISTPQPDYIDDTQQVVEEALEPAPQSQVQFKLVPTTSDWLNAKTDAFMIVCPVCVAALYQEDVEKHTAWHQMIAEVFQLLAQ